MPRTFLINYGSGNFQESKRLNRDSGLRVGGFDHAASFGREDIDAAFRAKNAGIFSQRRGDGYWLWKPYLIEKTLVTLNDGDFLFYSDAGAHFVAAIDSLIDASLRAGQDIVSFELDDAEKVWTKRDAFILMDCDAPKYTDTRQRSAPFMLFRKSDFSMQFVREYLRLAQDARLLTDAPNVMGQDNYPEFKDHRHDQSIFSLLAKKHELAPFRDPSQWGNSNMKRYPNSPYGQLIAHTRKRHKLFFRILRSARRQVTQATDSVASRMRSLTNRNR